MTKKYPTTPMCDGQLLAQFEPTVRDSDIFIPTTAKCGQTWLQTLLVHLKTKGREPNFRGRGLGDVSPWLELPPGFGYASQAPTREDRLAELAALDDPRIFKMHVIWDEVPRPPGSKARVITITRDPRDVPYSMFAHLQAMNLEDGPPATFDAYFERWMGLGLYFKLVASYWPHRDEPDFLWLRYEDMQRDLEGQARRLIAFLGWDVSDEDLARVLPLVDFGEMRSKEREAFFLNESGRWKDDKQFFREGGMGKNRARLSAAQEQRILERLHAELPAACCEFLLTLGERDAG